MSFNLEELNRVFTTEGHLEAIERSTDGADGFPLPVAAPDGGQQALASQPGTNQGIVSQNLQNQQQADPELMARMEQIGQHVDGVVNENSMLRNALQRVGAYVQQQTDAQWAAQFQATTDPAARERMLTERFQGAYNALQTQAQQRERELQAAAQSLLVDGFTRDEVFGKYTNLTPEQQQLIRSLDNPDQRALFAAAFDQLASQNRQAATSAAAALHVASGAGRVGGAAPMGGDTVTADGRTPSGRPKSALEILKETAYQARGF